MVEERMVVLEVIKKVNEEGEVEVMREGVRVMVEEIMEVEV